MLHGSVVALVTPMFPDGSVDYASFEKLIDWHLTQGTHGFVILGTTGESATIQESERSQLICLALKTARGKVPIVVSAGANATSHTVALTQNALELGADAVLLVTPYYNKPTQEGLYRHYEFIAKSVSIPQILYNVPSRTGCDLLPETVARLSRFSNIVAIKEATPNITRLKQLLALQIPMDFLSGDDNIALEFILSGGKGVISVAANIVPNLMVRLCMAALQYDQILADNINKQLASLYTALCLESNPIPVKWALQKMGLIQSGIRLPLTLLSETHHAHLLSAMQLANLSFQKDIDS